VDLEDRPGGAGGATGGAFTGGRTLDVDVGTCLSPVRLEQLYSELAWELLLWFLVELLVLLQAQEVAVGYVPLDYYSWLC
jgi:hypothetical protein